MDNSLAEGGAVSDTALVNQGIVWKADYTGTHKFQLVYNKLINFVDIYTTLNRTYYTVVPVGPRGETHKPGAVGSQVVNTQEMESLTWEWAEAIRRNEWIFEQVGEP